MMRLDPLEIPREDRGQDFRNQTYVAVNVATILVEKARCTTCGLQLPTDLPRHSLGLAQIWRLPNKAEVSESGLLGLLASAKTPNSADAGDIGCCQ